MTGYVVGELVPVQCWCGRKLIDVPAGQVSAPDFAGVECGRLCRERFDANGIVDPPERGPRKFRTVGQIKRGI